MRLPPNATGDASLNDLTINEVLLAFWQHAERHYRTPSGTPSKELANFRDTLRPLKGLYGNSIAAISAH